MIRSAAATITLVVLLGSFALAQEAPPKLQVFAGYTLFHADAGLLTGGILDLALQQPSSTFEVRTNFKGWNAEAQYNADRWLGIAVDLGGRYPSPIIGASGVSGIPKGTAYSFLAGPVISYRTKSRMTPFIHALFGWDRTSLSASTISGAGSPVSSAATAYTDFAMALGGGLDYRISRHIAFRAGPVDFYHTSLDLNKFYDSAFRTAFFEGLETHQANVRVSAGVVVQF